MTWEYKSVSVKAAEVELDVQFNQYGVVGWEVFHISEGIPTNEISSKGNGIKIFKVQMKRTL